MRGNIPLCKSLLLQHRCITIATHDTWVNCLTVKCREFKDLEYLTPSRKSCDQKLLIRKYKSSPSFGWK